jgi:hypothetical protein
MPNGHIFTEEEIRRFDAELSATKTIFGSLAARFGLHALGYVRGYWPSAGIKKRSWFNTTTIRVSLVDKTGDACNKYELRETRMFEVGWFYTKLLGSNKIKEYTAEQMTDKNMLKEDIEKVLYDAVGSQ